MIAMKLTEATITCIGFKSHPGLSKGPRSFLALRSAKEEEKKWRRDLEQLSENHMDIPSHATSSTSLYATRRHHLRRSPRQMMANDGNSPVKSSPVPQRPLVPQQKQNE